MKKIYSTLFFLLSAILTHAQCMLVPISSNEKVNNSSLIIEGEVISKKAFWNTAHDYIYTSNLIRVDQILKGSVSQSFVEVITQGGIVESFKIEVEPALILSAEEHGVFMLNTSALPNQHGYNTYEAYGDPQGFIKFNVDGSANTPFKAYKQINVELKNELASLLNKSLADFKDLNPQSKFLGANQIMAMPVTAFSPNNITAGTASQLTITGTGFGATQGANFVQFRNADDGGATNITPHSTQYISWSNTQIVVQIPSRTTSTAGVMSGQAGSGTFTVNIGGTPNVSPSSLTVTYGHLNIFTTSTLTAQKIFDTRHHGLNGSGGMTWRMFTGFDSNTPAKNDFQTAFVTWRCNTYINWQIGATTAVNTIASDGTNVIRFDIGGELPGGVLGRCTSYFSGCFSGGTWRWHVTELDIVFDSGTNWQYGAGPVGGSQFDFESVVLHELGHGHQLSHVINNLGVMHYSIGGGQIKNTLNVNDIAGGNAVMTRNLSGAVCGNPIMVALTPGSCNLAAPVASFNVTSPVCTGQVINLNDNSANNPNQWLWTMTGGSPATATTQNATTSYATPGVKTITLQAINGIGSNVTTRTVNVISGPNVAVTSASVCSGSGGATLTASGANAYTWNPGGLTGSIQALNPGSTTNYTVTGTNGTCNNNGVGTLSVVNAPNIIAFQSSTAICVGETVTITIGGATSYTTNPGSITNTFVTVSPSTTTQYTITGSNGSVCQGTKTLDLVVNLCTSVSELNQLNDLQIYPNPAIDKLYLEFSVLFNGNIKIENILGQEIYSEKLNSTTKHEVSLQNMVQGIYFISVSDEKNNLRIIKVIKG
ncbi:MAG: T9SS type A sorting domain-containing protein [Sphingobacteriaceae bacterium]|nr:T9SS type A sorting domain-containing protein [Sphingobacteriaceae bacterium]